MLFLSIQQKSFTVSCLGLECFERSVSETFNFSFRLLDYWILGLCEMSTISMIKVWGVLNSFSEGAFKVLEHRCLKPFETLRYHLWLPAATLK